MKTSHILTSTLAAFLLSSYPKEERAYIKYCAIACNSGDNYQTTRQN